MNRFFLLAEGNLWRVHPVVYLLSLAPNFNSNNLQIEEPNDLQQVIDLKHFGQRLPETSILYNFGHTLDTLEFKH